MNMFISPQYGNLSLAAITLSLLAACGGGSDSKPATTAATPSSNLVSAVSLATPAGVSNAVTTRKLRYTMPAVRGGQTEANAMLFLPTGTAPADG
jgi:uncharacterized lipoprotein